MEQRFSMRIYICKSVRVFPCVYVHVCLHALSPTPECMQC